MVWCLVIVVVKATIMVQIWLAYTKEYRKLFSNQNELATFVPCAAHTLNLVGVHAAQVSPKIVTFLAEFRKRSRFLAAPHLVGLD